jgi:hypothetical protein
MDGSTALHEIARVLGKPHSCIRCLLLPGGGVDPIAQPIVVNPAPVKDAKVM